MSRKGSTAGLTSVIRSVAGNGTGRRERALVVGGGHVGRTVASYLNEDYVVTFVSRDLPVVERTARDDVTARHTEEIDATTLDEADAQDAALAIVASADDGVNLLVAQLLSAKFDVGNVVIRVEDPEKLDSFGNLEAETVCVPNLLVDEITDRLESMAGEIIDT